MGVNKNNNPSVCPRTEIFAKNMKSEAAILNSEKDDMWKNVLLSPPMMLWP